MAGANCWVINPEFAKGYKKQVLDIGGIAHVFVEELGVLCTIADTYADKRDCLRGKEAVLELGSYSKTDTEVAL